MASLIGYADGGQTVTGLGIEIQARDVPRSKRATHYREDAHQLREEVRMAVTEKDPMEWHDTYTRSVEYGPTLAHRVGDFPLSGFEEEDESHTSALEPPEDLPPSPSDSNSNDY